MTWFDLIIGAGLALDRIIILDRLARLDVRKPGIAVASALTVGGELLRALGQIILGIVADD